MITDADADADGSPADRESDWRLAVSVETSILHLFSDVRTIPANDLTADVASFCI